MAVFTLLLMSSIAGALTARTHMDVRSIDPDDEFFIVKNETFNELMRKRKALYYEEKTLLDQEPQKKEGTFYWLKDEQDQPFERCCCPFDPKTKLRKNGHGSFPKCKYLHAFPEGERSGPFWRLKRSIDPRRWGDWVCPGKLPHPHSLIGAHHSEDPKDVADCDQDKAEQRERQAEHEKEMQKVKEKIQATEQELSTLRQQWGCKTVVGREVDGTYCGQGTLQNVVTCKLFAGKCYTTACYECEKTGVLFSRRKGDGGVHGVAIRTTEAVRMDALEKCRVGCA